MYRGRLQRDLTVWVQKGLLTGGAAEQILAEYDARPQAFTVGRTLLMLSAILVAAALLLFVAANWQDMPRLLRVALLIGLIWASLAGAAYAALRGSTYLPGTLLVIGTAGFGAALALIGQMYQLSGDAASSALLWFLMCLSTAILFRSAALTYFAGALAWYFLAMQANESSGFPAGLWAIAAPLQAVAVVALARYTGAARARHLSYILLLTWLGWKYIDHSAPELAAAYAAGGAILFLAATLPASPLNRFARQAGSAPAFYSFVLAVMGLCLYQFEKINWSGSSTLDVSIAMAALAAAFAVLAVALDGRDNAAVRYAGYAVFAGQLLYISLDLAGSMMGTSGLFLSSGLFLGLVAWAVIRLEKRFARSAASETGETGRNA